MGLQPCSPSMHVIFSHLVVIIFFLFFCFLPYGAHYKLILIGFPILYQAALGQSEDQSIACSVIALNHNRIIQRRIPL